MIQLKTNGQGRIALKSRRIFCGELKLPYLFWASFPSLWICSEDNKYIPSTPDYYGFRKGLTKLVNNA